MIVFSSRLPACLLWALCLSVPALAQDSLLDETLAGVTAVHDLAPLQAALHAAFSNDLPYRTESAALLAIADAPLNFGRQLKQVPGLNSAPSREYDSGVRSFLKESYLALVGKNLDCSSEVSELPVSVQQGADQIAAMARQSVTGFTDSISARELRNLRREHQRVLDILSVNPYGGDLSRRQRRSLRRFFQALDSADQQVRFCDAWRWAALLNQDWLDHMRTLLQEHADADAQIIHSLVTSHGRILFGGRADNNYQLADALFILDLGGDDIYGLETAEIYTGSPQLVIDLAGNDRYESSSPAGFAAGVGRTAFTLDLGGDDHYDGPSLSQAAAILGTGILIDAAGNDDYRAGLFSQGFALFGSALLEDRDGNDSVDLLALGQGLGMTRGFARLLDGGGNDSYRAKGIIPTNYGTPGLTDAWAQGVGLGIQNRYPGGIGMLLDLGGSDRYDGASFAQGGGYYYGYGALIDSGSDDDSYLGSRYNFGWGAHAGMGYFSERGGNDSYRTRQIVAAGLAWDHSLALFEDLQGDDSYTLGDFSLGASAHHSIAFFVDLAGSDAYQGTRPARANEGPPNLSLFIDTGDEVNALEGVDMSTSCSRGEAFGYALVIPSQEAIDVASCQSPSR